MVERVPHPCDKLDNKHKAGLAQGGEHPCNPSMEKPEKAPRGRGP